MSKRHRELPSWMAKKNVKVKEIAPLKSQRKVKAARAVLYCMNEAELVEAAISYLTNSVSAHVTSGIHQQVGQKSTDTMKKRDKPISSKQTAKPLTKILEEDSSECDSFVTTHVSGIDLDITEVETLPYTKHPESEGEKILAQDDQELINKERKMPVGENDGLQLVREIFFP